MLVNDEFMVAFTYVAIDFVGYRVLEFGEDHVNLSTYCARELPCVTQYNIATSREPQVDLDGIDDLVQHMIGKPLYAMSV